MARGKGGFGAGTVGGRVKEAQLVITRKLQGWVVHPKVWSLH